MSVVPIAVMMIGPGEKLWVIPDVSEDDKYEFIYRDASGIRWDPENRCLYPFEPKELPHHEWLKIIRNAVMSEYGDDLVLTKLTHWENVDYETRMECEKDGMWQST